MRITDQITSTIFQISLPKESLKLGLIKIAEENHTVAHKLLLLRLS